MSSENEKIKAALSTFFDGLNSHQPEKIREVWHPDAKLFIGGDAQSTSFFESLPEFIGFEVQEVERVEVYETIASAEVNWLMKMPGSVGVHTSYFTLIKTDDNWSIAGGVDHGIEESG